MIFFLPKINLPHASPPEKSAPKKSSSQRGLLLLVWSKITRARFLTVVPFLGVMMCPALFPACGMVDSLTSKNAIDPREASAAAESTEERRRARIRLELAVNYYQQRQFAVALDEIRQALAIDASLADAYGMRALVYMELGEKQSAAENFSRALSLAPNDPDLNNNYAWFLCQSGRANESYAYFSKAARNPVYATPAKPLVSAGQCAMREKNYATAEGFFVDAFRLEPGNAITNLSLGTLYLRKNELERAQFYARRLNQLIEPTAETLWLTLRLARKQRDALGESAAATQLRRRFANSNEYSLLQRGAYDE